MCQKVPYFFLKRSKGNVAQYVWQLTTKELRTNTAGAGPNRFVQRIAWTGRFVLNIGSYSSELVGVDVMTALLPKIFIASINASYFKPLDLRHSCLLRQILLCWQAITLDSLEQTSNRYLKEKEPSRRFQ